jgi:hypothetical protein
MDAWLPSRLTLYVGKHKRALLVLKTGIPAEAGTVVLLLARRAGDDLVLQVPGTVSKARRNYVEIRLPWDAAVSLAVFAGRKIDANNPEGKVVIHDYVIKIERWRPPLRQ